MTMLSDKQVYCMSETLSHQASGEPLPSGMALILTLREMYERT